MGHFSLLGGGMMARSIRPRGMCLQEAEGGPLTQAPRAWGADQDRFSNCTS